ncbi:response regulator transcription factor [Nodosilinea sp. FACHB-13]|nr:response regulator transcription factor [Nodosilinea sp. FACHB-13]
MLADSASGVNGSESEDEEAQFIEISRFEVNGYLCAVVKVEPELSAANDLTRLLTDRELQVATLVAMGRPNKQIARQLRISEWTVSTHLRRIFLKLGVDSRAAMVYRCASMIQCQT